MFSFCYELRKASKRIRPFEDRQVALPKSLPSPPSPPIRYDTFFALVNRHNFYVDVYLAVNCEKNKPISIC